MNVVSEMCRNLGRPGSTVLADVGGTDGDDGKEVVVGGLGTHLVDTVVYSVQEDLLKTKVPEETFSFDPFRTTVVVVVVAAAG